MTLINPCCKKIIYILVCLLGFSPLLVYADNPRIDIQTTQGVITIELAADKVPLTTQNFQRYMQEGFYNNTLFHRVIDDFVIQGGGYTTSLELKENHAPIPLEPGEGLSNVRGSIAMARGSNLDSARSQFFINTGDNLFLDDSGYAVFGQVIEGMDVVDAISAVLTGTVATDAGIIRNVPEQPIVIEVIRLRTGQLSFATLQESYRAGDLVLISLEETMTREEPLDLWVAALALPMAA